MHRAGQFLGQGLVDHSVNGDTVLTLETVSDNFHCEMTLTTRAGTGMSGVEMAVIDHIQLGRREGGLQLGFD